MKDAKILVVGDIMLDRYVYGKVDRVSPEAPIPILTYGHESVMPGGAGNVARNLVGLGCHAVLIGSVGCDSDGERVSFLLRQGKVTSRLFRRRGLSTVVKTRFISGTSHLLRMDSEQISSFSLNERERAVVLREIAQADLVVLSDYGKGFLSESVCRLVISECLRFGKKVVVDPKGVDYKKYHGVTLVKPNMKEFSDVVGRKFNRDSSDFESQLSIAARELAARHEFGGVLITLGEGGMCLVPADSRSAVITVPTEAKEVFDVSGAGDTALAALAAFLVEGCDMETSMRMANKASGISVSKLGTAVVSRDEIEQARSEGKIMSRRDAVRFVERCRSRGMTVGFTNGCFDCCHYGHLSSLRNAKSYCDVLVVGVNSDRWIRRHKGQDRPIQSAKTRLSLLASLEMVDVVVEFGDETALPLVKAIRPNVIAKEGYALKDWPEGRWVKENGGNVVVLAREEGFSTTSLACRMKGVHE